MEIGAGGGIQPAKARCFDRAVLPTQGHRSSRFVEAWAGIEPAYADLQSAASPLCHQAARGTAVLYACRDRRVKQMAMVCDAAPFDAVAACRL